MRPDFWCYVRRNGPIISWPHAPSGLSLGFLPSSQLSSFQPGMFITLAQPLTEIMKYQIFVSASLSEVLGLKRSPQINIIQPHLKTLYVCNRSHSPDKAITHYHISFAPDCTVYDQVRENVLHANSAISNIYINSKAKRRRMPS
jgi:hypothetical protein